MHYLVTGGAGFIGSHLVDALVSQNNHVTVLDNLSTGRSGNLLAVRSQVAFVHGSVLDPHLTDELVCEADVVVHLAAAVGVRLIVERPLHSFITNIKGAENVLEAAHRYKTKVMLASTSEIYGKNTNVPFAEDDDRLLGSNKIERWSYSASKAVDEILGFAYYREKGLPTVIVRLFNTVGPRQSSAYGMVIPTLVHQALRGEPLTIFGDGSQTRCFCHVRDVVRAFLALVEEPGAEGDVFNVGGTEEISIKELAEKIVAATGSRSVTRFIPLDQAYGSGFEDMQRRVPSIEKIKALTGWEPELGLDEIIAEVVEEARHPSVPMRREDDELTPPSEIRS